MLTDELERALDWPIPRTISEGRDIVTTIVMLPREHMPDGFIGLGHFPILADPKSLLAMLIPHRYWPPDLIAAWKTKTNDVLKDIARRPHDGISLTQSAIEAVIQMAAEGGLNNYYLRIALVPEGTGFRYCLDLTEDEPTTLDRMIQCGPIVVLSDIRSADLLAGTEIDYSTHRATAGFSFNRRKQ